MNKFNELLASLTIDQAKAWNATSEKTLFIDYEILCDAGFKVNNFTLDAIEAKLEELLSV